MKSILLLAFATIQIPVALAETTPFNTFEPSTLNTQPLLITAAADNRQDRRQERGRSDERQDKRNCKQAEGRTGKDKRDCKQEEVRDGLGGRKDH